MEDRTVDWCIRAAQRQAAADLKDSLASREAVPDCVGQLIHLTEHEQRGIDFPESCLPVALGLGSHVLTLGLATGKIVAGGLQEATAQLDERDEQPLSISLESPASALDHGGDTSRTMSIPAVGQLVARSGA